MPSWSEILVEVQQSAQARGGPPDYDGIRRRYLSELCNHTGRNTILDATRFTSQDTPPPVLSIVDEDLTGIMTVIHRLRGPNLDLILHSPGGSIEAAESLVEYLRSKFRNIRVIVPHLALSAPTIVACGANVVVMGKHSFLGPIDPQILVQTPLGSSYVPAQAIIEQFEKAVEECQDSRRLPAWIPMLSQYGPHLLVFCDNASELSKALVQDWLRRWMLKDDSNRVNKSREIANCLANHREFRSHARHIPRHTLKRKGFRVEYLETDQRFQDLILSVFHATTHTFNGTAAGKIIENQLGAAFVKMVQQIQTQVASPSPVQPRP
jgi:hypothetical protein